MLIDEFFLQVPKLFKWFDPLLELINSWVFLLSEVKISLLSIDMLQLLRKLHQSFSDTLQLFQILWQLLSIIVLSELSGLLINILDI